MKVAWVSCLELPEPDPDEPDGLAGFQARGHEVRVVPWDDPAADWSGFDAALIRSPWNYPLLPDAFRAWLRAERPIPTWNPPEVTLWNMHKGYLFELERAGVPIVPTEMGRPGASARALAEARGWTEVVVKPAVGGGSMGARKFSGLDEVDAHADGLGGDFLVQPALEAFTRPGEFCAVWVDGAFTHTVHKRPRLAGDDEAVQLGPRPDAEIRAFAQKALDLAPGPLLYARVDYVRHEGQWMLSELELLEPSLFWFLGGHATESLDRLVEGLVRRGRGA